MKLPHRDDDALICPSCGGSNLHHVKVETFWRAQEDAGQGVHVASGDRSTVVDDDMMLNPSSRRDGLLVHFGCENCDHKSVLRIGQHKGETFLSMV